MRQRSGNHRSELTSPQMLNDPSDAYRPAFTERARCNALRVAVGLLASLIVLSAAAQTRGEAALLRLLGEGTPQPVPLWSGQPPKFVADAPPESVDEKAHIRSVSVPTLSVCLPPTAKRIGMALIVCAGGCRTEIRISVGQDCGLISGRFWVALAGSVSWAGPGSCPSPGQGVEEWSDAGVSVRVAVRFRGIAQGTQWHKPH